MPCMSNFSEDFHNFELVWERDEMFWLVDGLQSNQMLLNRSWYEPQTPIAGQAAQHNPYSDIRQPWTEQFHLILNLAVGGDFLSGPDVSNAGSYNLSVSPSPASSLRTNDTARYRAR